MWLCTNRTVYHDTKWFVVVVHLLLYTLLRNAKYLESVNSLLSLAPHTFPSMFDDDDHQDDLDMKPDVYVALYIHYLRLEKMALYHNLFYMFVFECRWPLSVQTTWHIRTLTRSKETCRVCFVPFSTAWYVGRIEYLIKVISLPPRLQRRRADNFRFVIRTCLSHQWRHTVVLPYLLIVTEWRERGYSNVFYKSLSECRKIAWNWPMFNHSSANKICWRICYVWRMWQIVNSAVHNFSVYQNYAIK